MDNINSPREITKSITGILIKLYLVKNAIGLEKGINDITLNIVESGFDIEELVKMNDTMIMTEIGPTAFATSSTFETSAPRDAKIKRYSKRPSK